LAGTLPKVNSIDELRGKKSFNKASIIAEWQKILKINYWPIFDIARRILEHIPVAGSKGLIERLAETAHRLLESQLMRSHDLTGAVFQRMIVDRKFLAAYYTTPASAALLLGLAIIPEKTPAGTPWADPENVKALRIADFACGTGTLLTTAYQRIGQLHELAGGDSESIHAEMMAHTIIGCDVLPAAAHLTASMISGAHPTVKYEQSLIMTVPYGKISGGIALGSLELLDPQAVFEPLAITAKAAEGMGEKERETWSALPHKSFDLVVMNPPFTRPTNHEGSRHNVPNPMFAAFSSTVEEQRMMAEATKRLTAGTSAHGNAGEASIFLVLADRKLRDGGVLALVMPLSLVLGESWKDSRKLLAKSYSDLVIISIAGATDEESSFSADTDMAECLVVGRKSKSEDKRATFVVLKERPAYPLEGASAAEQIRRLIAEKKIRRLEDGPMGGTPLYFGNNVIGQGMDAPLLESGGGWNLGRIADLSLAQAAYQLATDKRVWLPMMSKADAISVPITTIGKMGETGPIDRDIDGINPDGNIRGPFDIVGIEPGHIPTYPVLWSHVADRERTLSFDGDSEAVPRIGLTPDQQEAIATKVESVWATASHSHFNINFRFNSQSTGMQFTPRKTIGGRAWQSIKLSSVEQEKALVLWANTSLGMLLRWWHSNKQQSGRGNIGKTALQSLPVLDVTTLSPQQLEKAVTVFDQMREQSLLPLHEMDRDPARKKLDERFAREVLGMPEPILQPGGPLEVLRMKLAQEPSIRGNK
jgi:hypothetical protein